MNSALDMIPCVMGNHRLDIVRQRFGRVTVLSSAGSVSGKSFWHCVCDCGTIFSTKGVYLKRGATRSCGCLSGENNKKHGGVGTSTYRSWAAMKTRCLDKNSHSYNRYGGRGIKIAHRWMDFGKFILDMGERPLGKSLDRFPNKDGDYKPGNCRWATRKEQANNTRRTVLLSYKGVTLCLMDMAKKYRIPRSTLKQRLDKGWPINRAISQPIRPKNRRVA